MDVKMKYSIFASGSKGNCTYIQAGSTQLVIDCGMTKRYLTQSFHSINVDLNKIDALLITHDHSDHISQLKVFNQIECVVAPVLLDLREDSQVWMPYIKHRIKDVEIMPIVLSHDCEMIFGYIIYHEDEKLVYMTDTGYVKSKDFNLIQDADYYIIESNHDVDLLMKSNRPYMTKQRILSDTGHLSNEDCAYLLSQLVTPKTKDIVLAHLSQEANQPSIAIQCVIEAFEKEGLNPNDYSIRCAEQNRMIQGGLDDEEIINYEPNLSIAHLE
jgi:phosphoribosyl 1,2-cyclic phosphodiesterase